MINPCENCIHLPICRIREDYRQLLIDTEPFNNKNPAFSVKVDCKHFRTNYGTATRGNEAMNTL